MLINFKNVTSVCLSNYAWMLEIEYIILCNFGGRFMSGFEVI